MSPATIDNFDDLDKIANYLEKSNSLFYTDTINETKENLAETIYSNNRGIYIFTGERGVGKSRLLHEVIDEIKNDIFFLANPPLKEREFLEEIYMQLRGKKFSQNVKIDEARIRVNDAFKKISHTIIIDNINKDSFSIVEDIENVLDELSGLKILFVMDNDAINKLEKLNLDSKLSGKVELEPLSKIELNEYIKSSLQKHNVNKEMEEILKQIDFIYEVTQGNIKKVIDLISTSFSIVALANREGIDKFKSMNECIIIMSAIDRELLDG